MWKLSFAVIAFGFSIGLASAQNQIAKVDPIALNKNKTTALARLSGEYLECSAYFSVTAYCMANYPAPAVTKIVRDYQDAAKTALKLATSADRLAGVNNSSVDETVRRCSNGAHQTQLLEYLRSVGALSCVL